MLSPFGYNEFQGAGGGYAVKFSSIAEGEAQDTTHSITRTTDCSITATLPVHLYVWIVDENVVVGTAPASAGRESIADYGSLEDLGAKLLRNR